VEIDGQSVSREDAFANALQGQDTSDIQGGETDTTPVVQPEQAPAVEATPQTGGHPAWQEILQAVPQSLHETVRPTLEKWDAGVTEKLQKVHSQYAPFKDFAERQVPPDVLNAGLRLYEALNNDPKGFYQKLHERFGGQGQQQNSPQQEVEDLGEFSSGEFDISKDPRFQQLQMQQQQMQEAIQQQAARKAEEEASAWLDRRINEVQSQYKQNGIDLDMDYIMGVAAAKINANPQADPDNFINEAAAQYAKMVSNIKSTIPQKPTAPTIAAPSGATPKTNFNAAKMSDQERRSLFADMLNRANG
jgi:hypothetical protein